MTSMPASRSARAMIFAPRSWPSSPGFAMTTLIFPGTTRSLEHWRLAPDAPHVAQGFAHLAHRHVRPRGVHDRLHQIAVRPGRIFFQPSEGLFHRSGVAPHPNGVNALDLSLLERGIDPEDVRLRLVVELVAVDADDDALVLLDLRLVAVRGLGDLALEEVLLDRRNDSAELVDPVEILVGLSLELAREVLDVVRAAEGVDRVHSARLVRDHLLR